MGSGLKLLAQLPDFEIKDFSHGVRTRNSPYRHIDTSLQAETVYHQDPFGQANWGYLNLGNQGSWRQNLFLPNPLNPAYHLGMPGFEQHFRSAGKWPYYYVHNALTEADYRQGIERGQLFRVFHTQNVHERLNFLVDFHRLNSLGLYARQQVEQSDFLANFHYLSKKGKYQIHSGFNTAIIRAQANGGLVYDSVFTQNTITDRSIVPVRFAQSSAQQILRNRSFELDHIWHFINRSGDSASAGKWLQKLSIQHQFSYLRQSYVFNDIPGDQQPSPLLQSFETSDSVHFEKVRNRMAASVEGKLNFNAGIWLESAKHEGINFINVENSLGLDAQLNSTIGKNIPLFAKGEYVWNGSRQGGLWLFAEAGFNNKQFGFLPYLEIKRAFPGFMAYRHTSNYSSWNQSFELSTTSELGVRLRQAFLGEVTFSLMNWNKPVYYNENALPTQANGSLTYLGIEWHARYQIGRFVFLENRLKVQRIEGLQSVVNLPNLVNRALLYTEFKLFKKAVKLQPGFGLMYFSETALSGYSPTLNQFYFQNAQEMGGVPLADAFLNIQLGHARFYFKLEHWNAGLSGYQYLAAPGYPLPDMVFRAGLNWRFFN